MTFKRSESEPAPDPREIDRFDGGVGWIAYPDEGMQRASHALVGGDDGDERSSSGNRTGSGDDVWIVDPVDAEGVEDIYADLGEVVGVVVALDRHLRDAETVARRHDVPVYVAEWMRGALPDLDVETETFGPNLPGSSYRAVPVIDNPIWKEVALYDPEGGTLLVPEAVGTTDYFRTQSERLGVHPALRAFPPRKQFRDVAPERVLVGHGEGIMEDGASALREALGEARKRMPAAYVRAAREMLPF